MTQRSLYEISQELLLDQEHECNCVRCRKQRQVASVLMFGDAVMRHVADMILTENSRPGMEELKRRYYLYAGATMETVK